MELLFFFALSVKHALADLYLQSKLPFGSLKLDLKNPKGYRHALDHGALTFVVALLFTGRFDISISLAMLDFLLHFFIDYVKAVVANKLKLETYSEKWWMLTTLDQILHTSCYLMYTYILFF